ncbi:MAG TPA: glycosyltransferase family 2 protein [Syntrophales bacterium]|nr:glycosyltransferase family 2 protein [Syntrophales bacterium]
MDLSFVLLTWNSMRYVENCLNSVIHDVERLTTSFEIHIVDNGSSDGTVSCIESFTKRYPDSIKPIYLDRNTGTTYSRNLALRIVQGKYILVMDSDVEVPSGAIGGLINSLDRHPEAGIVTPRLIYPSGKLQKSTDVFPTVFTKLYRYFFLRQIETQEAARKRKEVVQEVDYAISAVWAMRSELLHRVGLLDENFFYAPEDVDYCLRVWKAGCKVLYDPTITCIHHTQEISRGFKFNISTWHHIQGLVYYFRKHGYIFFRPENIRTGKR